MLLPAAAQKVVSASFPALGAWHPGHPTPRATKDRQQVCQKTRSPGPLQKKLGNILRRNLVRAAAGSHAAPRKQTPMRLMVAERISHHPMCWSPAIRHPELGDASRQVGRGAIGIGACVTGPP